MGGPFKSSSSTTKELKPTFEELLKEYFEKQDRLPKKKSGKNFQMNGKERNPRKSKLLIEKESTQGLGNKLKISKRMESLKLKSKKKSLLDKEFHELIQKAVDICIQEKNQHMASLRNSERKANLFPGEQNQNDQIGEKPSGTDEMTSSDPIL